MQFSDLYETRSRKIVMALIAIALCLVAIQSTPGHSYRSKIERKAADPTSSKTPSAIKDAIRPFRVRVPEKQLVNLRRRLAESRWPSKELVADRSQGVQLATLKELARYWATEYDWRKAEAKLNALPQFVTQIDGVDIHFIHASPAVPPYLVGSVRGPTVSRSSMTEPGQGAAASFLRRTPRRVSIAAIP